MTHSSVLAWRIPGTREPGGLPSMGSHGVGHDCSDLAAAAAWWMQARGKKEVKIAEEIGSQSGASRCNRLNSQKCSMNNGAFSKSTHRDSHCPNLGRMGQQNIYYWSQVTTQSRKKNKSRAILESGPGYSCTGCSLHKGPSFSTNGF